MGTETPITSSNVLSNAAMNVKLNNPLMGTETHHCLSYLNRVRSFGLN